MQVCISLCKKKKNTLSGFNEAILNGNDLDQIEM